VQVLAERAANRFSVGSDDLRAVLDERLLVEQARRDPEAFTLLYRAYVGRVHGFAFRRTGSYEEAEEVTAAVFERAWRALPAFAWRGGGFEPWLFRIAANELISHHRRKARTQTERVARVLREMAEDLKEDPELAALLEVDERERRIVDLRRAMSTLPPRYQEVITLRYLSGLGPKEAAAAMGCSKATLAVVLHRAITALRKAIDTDVQAATS
jgi:RNA polymerase sigma-70 factor (ECF subfamily)